MSSKITAKMSILEIVNKHPGAAEVFFNHGLHCLGCVAARFETLEQGCQAHGIDTQKLVDDLNKAVDSQSKQTKTAKPAAKTTKKQK